MANDVQPISSHVDWSLCLWGNVCSGPLPIFKMCCVFIELSKFGGNSRWGSLSDFLHSEGCLHHLNDVPWGVQACNLVGLGGIHQHSQYSESWGSQAQGQLSLHSETLPQKQLLLFLVCDDWVYLCLLWLLMWMLRNHDQMQTQENQCLFSSKNFSSFSC